MKATIMDACELPAVLTVRQIQQLLGISKAKAYELVHRRNFPVIYFGKAIRVPKEALVKWLEQQARGGNSGR